MGAGVGARAQPGIFAAGLQALASSQTHLRGARPLLTVPGEGAGVSPTQAAQGRGCQGSLHASAS